uniref:Uncharacterized protein n=1 Tax=Trichobilharzia regenti TaxID=157069 RepID=A0AA85K2F1_TRIRE|nr:unnamed protein product [Trichobilharzia regenti]
MANYPEDALPKLFPEECASTLPSIPPLPRPPMFQLSLDYPRWKKRMQAYLDIAPASHHFIHVLNSLSDDAYARADAAGFSNTNSMRTNWEILDQCFDLGQSSQLTMLRFYSRRQLSGESFLDYLHALQLLAAGLDCHKDLPSRDQAVCTRFVEGMMPGELRTHLRRQLPTSTVELQRIILRFMDAENDYTPTPSSSRYPRPTAATVTPARSDRSRSRWRSNEDATRGCYYYHRYAKKARKCGHNRQPDRSKSYIFNLSTYSRSQQPLMLWGYINGVPSKVLLDTGASVSFVKAAFLRRVPQHSPPVLLLLLYPLVPRGT